MVDGEDLDAFVARVVIMAVFYYHPFCLLAGDSVVGLSNHYTSSAFCIGLHWHSYTKSANSAMNGTREESDLFWASFTFYSS